MAASIPDDIFFASMTEINQKLKDVEYKLITRADALSDDKYFQTAYNLYQNLIWLNGEIGTGAGDEYKRMPPISSSIRACG